jgi:hypothetical protein
MRNRRLHDIRRVIASRVGKTLFDRRVCRDRDRDIVAYEGLPQCGRQTGAATDGWRLSLLLSILDGEDQDLLGWDYLLPRDRATLFH